MNIKELILIGQRKLKEKNIKDANLKSKLLLANLLKISKEQLIIHLEQEITKKLEKEYMKNIQELAEGKPIQYIIKSQEFMMLDFYVDENVLIPQPDTEVLVEEAIQIAKHVNENMDLINGKLSIENKKIEVLDLCTGSGAIAVSIAKYIENIEVIATDISKPALDVAMKNAENNRVLEKVHFILSDMFENIENRKFNIIVSNPPYIEKNLLHKLEKEVQYEPKIALDGGKDGLDFYRIIEDKAPSYLKQDGYVLLEIGYNQKESVMNIFNSKKWQTKCIKDLSGQNRVIIAKKIDERY